MKISVYAIGRLAGPEQELAAEYEKRLHKVLRIREWPGSVREAEGKTILAALPEKAFVVLLDERGKDVSSQEFADKMAHWRDTGPHDLVFIIGGADGVTDEVKARADFTLGLGRKTWPHKLARVMLLEQIYRAQQINAGHPYHRA